MKWIIRLLSALVINAVALYAATYFIPGFWMSPTLEAYAKVALVFTVIGAILRPILKVVLGPLILITFGIGIVVVNALILYLLDHLMPELAISGLIPLVYATLLISVVNSILSVGARRAAESNA